MSRLQKLLGVGKGYLERLPPVDVHKLLRLILLNLPYIMIFYVGNKLAWLYQYCAGNSHDRKTDSVSPEFSAGI